MTILPVLIGIMNDRIKNSKKNELLNYEILIPSIHFNKTIQELSSLYFPNNIKLLAAKFSYVYDDITWEILSSANSHIEYDLKTFEYLKTLIKPL